MAIAGRVAIVPKGDWSADATYKRLDAVTHNNTLYFAKKDVPAGTETSNTEYWSKSIVGSAVIVDDALSSTSTNPVQNKVVTSNLIDIRKETTVNLIIPILQTVTGNGITCTNNGDGTYTFNGTATDNVFFDINKNISINKGTKYKVVCFKDEDYAPSKILSCVRRVDTTDEYTFNNGSFVADSENCWLWVTIAKDATVSNLVAKPMLTTNLSATYDDFVPYTGDTGKLNGDVAELKAQSVKKDNVVNNQTTTEEGFALDARQANPNIDGTLAKQIAEINGSLEKLNDFTDILNNDNLNDIKFFNVGKYRCSFNGVAETVLNSPFNTAFTMEVFQSSGTPQYIAQKAIEYESGHCKWRMRDILGGIIVKDWVQLY